MARLHLKTTATHKHHLKAATSVVMARHQDIRNTHKPLTDSKVKGTLNHNTHSLASHQHPEVMDTHNNPACLECLSSHKEGHKASPARTDRRTILEVTNPVVSLDQRSLDSPSVTINI